MSRRDFAEWIRKYIDDNHLSINAMAHKMGMSGSTLSRTLSQKTAPSLDLFDNLAEVTGESAVYLYALAYDKKMPTIHLDATSIQIARLYEALPEEERFLVNGLIDNILRNKGKGKQDIE